MKFDDLEEKEKDKIKQLKSKDKFENLKCDYFLNKLFNNLERKKTLNIVKYNKKTKKRMNIINNDYKEYTEKYSPIEIEIKPVNNTYGTFINFKNEDEEYYHIYFNNNKEEIKRNRINKGEHITIIKIIIDYQVKSFVELLILVIVLNQFILKNFIGIISLI